MSPMSLEVPRVSVEAGPTNHKLLSPYERKLQMKNLSVWSEMELQSAIYRTKADTMYKKNMTKIPPLG